MSRSFGAILPLVAAAIFATAVAILQLGVRFLYSRALLLRR